MQLLLQRFLAVCAAGLLICGTVHAQRALSAPEEKAQPKIPKSSIDLSLIHI